LVSENQELESEAGVGALTVHEGVKEKTED